MIFKTLWASIEYCFRKFVDENSNPQQTLHYIFKNWYALIKYRALRYILKRTNRGAERVSHYTKEKSGGTKSFLGNRF